MVEWKQRLWRAEKPNEEASQPGGDQWPWDPEESRILKRLSNAPALGASQGRAGRDNPDQEKGLR